MSTDRSSEQNYAEAAQWAEDEMTMKPASTTALRGTNAAAFGRDLVERATEGQPSLDPDAVPG